MQGTCCPRGLWLLVSPVTTRLRRRSSGVSTKFLSPPLSTLCFLDGSHYTRPTCRRRVVSFHRLGAEHLQKSRRSLLRAALSILHHVFIDESFFISIGTHKYLFYILRYNPVFLFFSLECSGSVRRALSQLSCTTSRRRVAWGLPLAPSLLSLSLSLFLPPSLPRFLSFFLSFFLILQDATSLSIFPFPALKLAVSPRSPGSFY